MSRLRCDRALIALVYQDSARAETLLSRIADHLRAHRLRLAGLIQHTFERPDSSRCDMELEDLTSGERTSIRDDRGSGALACTLDADALLKALVQVKARLDSSIDLLLLNKFGKMEAEGGGFRPLIVAALEQEIPVLVAVPERNLAAWKNFAEDISALFEVETLPQDPQTLLSHLGIRFSSKRVASLARLHAN